MIQDRSPHAATGLYQKIYQILSMSVCCDKMNQMTMHASECNGIIQTVLCISYILLDRVHFSGILQELIECRKTKC